LRVVGIGVVFRVDGDDGMTRAEARAEAGRKARDATLDGKSGLFQQRRHQLRGLEFLHAKLGKIKNIVAETGDGLGITIEVVKTVGLGGAQIAVCVCHGSITLPAVVRSYRGSPGATAIFREIYSGCVCCRLGRQAWETTKGLIPSWSQQAIR